MKKTKIIIPALGVLLLSTAASVSGTVAWFSMNKTVTAKGMSVTAKSDSSFLLIGTGAQDLATIQGANTIEINATTASAELYPAAHETIANTAAAELNTNWYYRYSNDPRYADGSTAGMTDKTQIASADMGKYVLVNTFNVCVAAGGRSVADLKVGQCTIAQSDSGAQAVNVLVTSATASDEFSGTGAAGANVLASTVTASAVTPINVYIYWDGNNAAVTTNNVANLKNTTVTLTFTYSGLASE